MVRSGPAGRRSAARPGRRPPAHHHHARGLRPSTTPTWRRPPSRRGGQPPAAEAAGPKRARQPPDVARQAQEYLPDQPDHRHGQSARPAGRRPDVDGADGGGPEIDGDAWFDWPYEGPPSCVHGGVIAETFDEMLGAACIVAGHPGMTGTLTVRYRKPTPLRSACASRPAVRPRGPQGLRLGRYLPRRRPDRRGRGALHRGPTAPDPGHRRAEHRKRRPGHPGGHPGRGQPSGGGRGPAVGRARRRGDPGRLTPPGRPGRARAVAGVDQILSRPSQYGSRSLRL